MSDPGKKYSLDNYSNLTPDDIDNIFEALGYDKRREILKFLALEATQPDKAKTRNEIASKIGVAQQQAIDHCDKLMSIGVILEILAKDPNSKWGGNVKKYYLVNKQLIEILAIIVAIIFIHEQQQSSTQKVKESIIRIFEEAKNYIRNGTNNTARGSSYLMQMLGNYQERSLQATEEIATNSIEAQRALINSFRGWWWWMPPYNNMENMNDDGMYYYWFPPQNMANTYANTTKLFTNYITSAAKLASVNALVYIGIANIFTKQAVDNAKQLSQIAVNAVKTFEPIARGSLVPTEEITTSLYVESAYNVAAMRKIRDEVLEILQLATNT